MTTMRAEQTASSVTCDECGRMLRPQVVEHPTADGGARQAFSCPHCHAEYLVCTISARGLELRGMLREAMETTAAIRREFQAEVTSYGE